MKTLDRLPLAKLFLVSASASYCHQKARLLILSAWGLLHFAPTVAVMATDSANGIGVDIDAMFLMGTAVQLFWLLLLLPESGAIAA